MINLIHGIGINDADYPITSCNENGKRVTCPYYSKWNSMLRRCYSEEWLDRYPVYKGCTVHKDWLNFMTFRAWMILQDWEGLELDKDILVPGNKVYSEVTCVFVSQALNSLLTNNKVTANGCPKGVSKYKEHKKPFRAQMGYKGTVKALGSYYTIEEASDAYIRAKYELILLLAMEQTDVRIHDGLIAHANLLRDK